jgi:hypothetical protein
MVKRAVQQLLMALLMSLQLPSFLKINIVVYAPVCLSMLPNCRVFLRNLVFTWLMEGLSDYHNIFNACDVTAAIRRLN